MVEHKWHFEFYETESPGWLLRIDSEDEVMLYMACSDVLDKDKRQYKRLESNPGFDDNHNIVSHTEFGGIANWIKKDNGFNTDGAYDAIKCIQGASMLRVMGRGVTLLVNRYGGFMVKREDIKPKASVWRKDLVFPSYVSHDIRIKRFDDGRHYYAFIGDMQVKDGDRVKWDTYDEAYHQAELFASDWRYAQKQGVRGT